MINKILLFLILILIVVIADAEGWRPYEALACHNLGKVYHYQTEFRLGRGCFTAKGTHLPPVDLGTLAGYSVTTSDEAHKIMRQESVERQ